MAAPRPTTPREDLAFTRIPQYNVRAYNVASNPYGFDEDGHAVNLMPLADDLGVVARYAGEMAATAHASAERIETAVEAIEAGPVVSVVGRSGVVTADHIKTAIGYEQLAADIEQDVEQAVNGLTGRVSAVEADFPSRALILSQAFALTGVR
ncbi:hypothetical protein [Aureimonas sp. SK2]|uniref:hypothetical protein n=1 Tax=Aureimonas sp. SK2 TaxID=3015992 RepID=UPI002444641E|nr:hypothetical protein [Aureimonas sp. SK2]